MTLAADYESALSRELERWPGVRVRHQMRGKHQAVILIYRGRERMVVYPVSGSDRRGPMNNVRDVRQALRSMGAKRLEPVKASGPRRERNRTEPRRPPVIEHATGGPNRDPWEPLRRLVNPDPKQPTIQAEVSR